MVQLFFFLLFLLHLSCAIDDHRLGEFSRISKHELIFVDTTEFGSKNIISFDAFGQHFKVKLEENEHMNPSILRHSNGNPSETHDHLQQYYTQLTKSCHYFGEVLNANDDESNVALSMCNNHGIRGQITAFGETIVIRPAKYYLDLQFDSTQHHQFSDQHLVFKLSDYDMGEGEVDAIAYPHDLSPHPMKQSSVQINTDDRRRLVQNKWGNYVEMAILIGPYRVAKYKEIYPNTWYEKLVLEHTELLNSASNIYKSTSWGSTVGNIRIVFVEIEMMEEGFTGDYSSLKPLTVKKYACSNTKICEIDMEDLVEKLQFWVKTHKDTSTFDNLQMFHNMNMGKWAGIAYMGTMCKSSSSVGHTAVQAGGLSAAIGTLAHELGHNFNLSHDGQEGKASICGENSGLMGYGSDKPRNKFSTCSTRDMRSFFANAYLKCLQYRSPPSSVRTNYVMKCITITGITGSSAVTILNGDYNEWGTFHKKPYYKHSLPGNSYYLFYGDDGAWYTSNSIWNQISTPTCTQEKIEDCSQGKWRQSTGGYTLASAKVASCVIDPKPDGNNCRNDVAACFTVTGLDHKLGSQSLNGQWYAMDNRCHEGENVYELKSTNQATLYMYRYKPFWWWKRQWRIHSTIGSDTCYAWCKSFEMNGCTNDFNVYISPNWVRDTNVKVTESCAAAFEIDACFEDKTYANNVCLSNKHALHNAYVSWNVSGDVTFKLFEQCSNDKKVYYHSIRNETANRTTTFYLHYNEYYEYSESNETSGRWIITIDELLAAPVTYCENEYLLDCVGGEWIFQDLSSDFGRDVYDNHMAVFNGGCHSDDDDDHKSSSSKPFNSGLVILGLLVVLLVTIVVGLLWVCSKHRMRKAVEDETDYKMMHEVEVSLDSN